MPGARGRPIFRRLNCAPRRSALQRGKRNRARVSRIGKHAADVTGI